MARRLPFDIRLGFALILTGLAWWSGWDWWASTRIWVPLDVPVSLSQGHIRTPIFQINVKGTYWVGIELEREIEGNPSVPKMSWSLSNGERAIAMGDGADQEVIGCIEMRLGRFNADAGHYRLDLHVLREGSHLNAGVPHLVIAEIGNEHANADYRLALALWVFLILTAAGLYAIIRWAILCRQEKLEAFARSCSLTQPMAAEGVHRVKYVPQEARPVYPRRFSGLSSFSLMLTIALLLLWIVILVIQSPVRRIVGLPVHFLRSGAVARISTRIQPLRIQLKSRGPDARPDLYLNSQLVPWENLGAVLQTELAFRPPHWPVYLEGDPEIEFRYAVRAIDIIRGVHGDVILEPGIGK